MIEFKRAGDAMVFECPSFTIEVCADSERIAINEAAASDPRAKEVITNAFEVLDMMVEHKMRHTRDRKVTEMNFKVNVDTKDAEEAIERINVKLNHETAEQASKRLFGKGI